MSVVSVYAIFASADEAAHIGRTVVEERLAACVNVIGPVTSIYGWRGTVETAEEVAAIFKTSHSAVDALIARVADLHSYDVPCIAASPIDKILASYADWVKESVG